MPELTTVALPGAVRAAAADGARVWCAAGGRLTAYAPTGSPLAEAEEPAGLVALAAAGDIVAAALEPGVLVWLDPATGSERQRLPVGGELTVAAGGGSVWAFDRESGRAWRLADAGVLTEPISLPGVDAFAPWRDRVWWTSRHDTLLREGERAVDLGARSDERGGMTVCSDSVWLSVTGVLLRVGAWAAQLGPPLPAPEGPVRLLSCSDGILIGGSGRQGLFVLDPSIDAGVRRLDVDLGGELAFLVATRAVAWAIPAGAPLARLVPMRPGA